jgi:prepilin-type N-terminal cleavage/methylation domain-containing protein
MVGDSDNTSGKAQETKAAHRLLTAKDVALAVGLSIVLTCVAAGFFGRGHSSPGTKPIEVRVYSAGFTLIEMSVVLVIVGLIVGGMLVGMDLVRSSEVRAQITQIEKYNTAVNTFRGKYQSIPGDMNVATAEQFGFTVGTSCTGQQGGRDGNGLIDGWTAPYSQVQLTGETALFWQDLSTVNLIDGQFPNSGAVAIQCTGHATVPNLTATPGTTYIGDYLPPAKIGHGNFIYVYETNSSNWYGLSEVTAINDSVGPTGVIFSGTSIPVTQAYNIDKKIDDGLPTAGNVQAVYLNASGSNVAVLKAPYAISDNSTTCYNTTSNIYSIGYQGGAQANCALSFQFQ